MTDTLTREQRSYNMSCIRGHDTKPERMLRKALWAAGLRYRIKNSLPGKPDIVFPSVRLAVFVDGCFWHGCPEHMTWPKNNADFWRRKIERNIERDREVEVALEELGWRWLRFWEHEVQTNSEQIVSRLNNTLLQSIRSGHRG